jgi:hypothetical protein
MKRKKLNFSELNFSELWNYSRLAATLGAFIQGKLADSEKNNGKHCGIFNLTWSHSTFPAHW